MRTLLCISDFPYTTLTVSFGGLVVSALQSEVSLLTVRKGSEAPEVGRAVLQQATELLAMHPTARLIRQGSPVEEILAEVKSGAYDLVIIGARDHPSLGELLLGLVARPVVSQADTSVLVVRQPREQLKHVLICTAGQEVSRSTVAAGARLAQAAQANVTLLHVAAAVPSMYAGLSRMGESLPDMLQTDTPLARHLKENVAQLRSLGVDTQLELRHGVPAEEILRAAENSFDLLVVGGSSHRKRDHIFLDNVSLQIVDHAPRPVLVVQEGLNGLGHGTGK